MRHPEKDLLNHHALNHRLLQNLGSPGIVAETDLDLIMVVSTIETEKIAIDGLGEMIEIMTHAQSHAHAHHQNDARPIVPSRIGIISLATGHPEFAAMIAAV
jgi:hypothetical protein